MCSPFNLAARFHWSHVDTGVFWCVAAFHAHPQGAKKLLCPRWSPPWFPIFPYISHVTPETMMKCGCEHHHVGPVWVLFLGPVREAMGLWHWLLQHPPTTNHVFRSPKNWWGRWAQDGPRCLADIRTHGHGSKLLGKINCWVTRRYYKYCN